MEHLPSEGDTEHKQHEIKIVASYYEDVVSGKKSFELRKNDRGYKQGDSLKMLEFKDGKHTGRTIDADIIYMLEDYTGLTEGYCILGIRVTDYTGKVSETDTEKDGVRVTVIETYKDKQAQQTFRPGKEFVVTAERAEVLVAAGVAKITK